MADVQIHFLDPLNEFFGRAAYGKGVAAKLQAYGDSLSDEALRAAADKLCETAKSPPNLVGLRRALQSAETLAQTPLSTEPRPWDIKARDAAEWAARRKACALCRCEMGREADREGWLPALIDFAAAHGRLPRDWHEEDHVRAKARRSENGLAACRDIPEYRGLVTLRVNMLTRASQDVFGAEALRHDAPVDTLQNKRTITTGRTNRAGSDYVEQVRAEATLEQIQNDPPKLAFSSPQLVARYGGKPQAQERVWTTEEETDHGHA